MSDVAYRSPGQTSFARVALVDDPAQCLKLAAGGPVRHLRDGTLLVDGHDLVWASTDRAITLHNVTNAVMVRYGFVGIDYDSSKGPAVALLHFRSVGGRQPFAATTACVRDLRTALGLPPLSPEQVRAEYAYEVAQAEAKMKAGRVRMLVSAAVLGFGVIMTMVSYSSSGEGEGFTLWWGAIVFGALWLLAGLADYRSGSNAKAKATQARTTPPATPPVAQAEPVAPVTPVTPVAPVAPVAVAPPAPTVTAPAPPVPTATPGAPTRRKPSTAVVVLIMFGLAAVSFAAYSIGHQSGARTPSRPPTSATASTTLSSRDTTATIVTGGGNDFFSNGYATAFTNGCSLDLTYVWYWADPSTAPPAGTSAVVSLEGPYMTGTYPATTIDQGVSFSIQTPTTGGGTWTATVLNVNGVQARDFPLDIKSDGLC